MAPLIFSIDGNIGSGKSRFLSYLKENIMQLLIGLPYDIKTYKFVHNRKNLFEMLGNHGYDILNFAGDTSLNILAERQ